jgi:hypothetical protein
MDSTRSAGQSGLNQQENNCHGVLPGRILHFQTGKFLSEMTKNWFVPICHRTKTYETTMTIHDANEQDQNYGSSI